MVDLNDPETKQLLLEHVASVYEMAKQHASEHDVTYSDGRSLFWVAGLLSSLKSKPAPIEQNELPFEVTTRQCVCGRVECPYTL